NPLLYAPFAWFLLTFPFKLIIERQRTLGTLNWVHSAFFVAEIAVITVLVHLMGGSEWIGSIFYLFTVVYANFFLPRLHGGLVTGLVVAAYAGLVMLEYAGVIPHRSLFESFGQPHRSFSYNLATLLAGPVSVYAIVAFTVRTFAGVYARKNRTLAAREQQLEQMSKRLLTAHDEERRRIARGLHDDLIQSLAAIKLRLAPARERLGEEQYQEISSIVDTSIAQTRTLAYSVRPPLLDDLGLLPSLQRLADVVSEESGLDVRVRSELDDRLDVAVESLLFHVAREGLQNVVRHAQAEHVEIVVAAVGGRARLSIRDNGIGFRPEDPQGLGLRGVRERVEVCGGVLLIETSPGSGATVTLEVPCRDDTLDHRR
ncbi:MAG: sensor histidine kinase, partial [Candidatus Bipolaricaulota bacterium]